MRKATLTAALFIAGASISMLSACGDGPTGPAKPAGSAFITTVQLTGPATIEPGGTATYKMMSTWSDGSTRDVTIGTTWSSSRPDIVSIAATGVATAHERGAATISASIGGRTASRNVIVVPTGTYQLSGSVTEGPSIPLHGARVEAISGTGTLTTTTAQDGAFTLYGVAPSAELRVSKEGYVPHSQPLALSNHAFLGVSLKPNGPVLDISGTYMLTISAGPCTDAPALSAAMKTRTYTARVTQEGRTAQVVLEGRTFAPRGTELSNRFFGFVGATAVSFSLSDDDFYSRGPLLIEQFEDGTFLSILGDAQAPLPGAGMIGVLTGVLDGRFAHYRTPGPLLGMCTSRSHGFVMTR